MLDLEQTVLERVSDTNAEVVHRYRESLPSNEYQALIAWLGTFYPFQLEWLLDPSPYAACNKSRQIGLSHTTGAAGDLWGGFHGELTTIVSVGELESSEVLDKARKHAQLLEDFGSRMCRVVSSNAISITFASGGRIIALPSTGGRSFTGNIFIDEFAYHRNQTSAWDAAMAVTMHGSLRARIASTPNGVGDLFHDLISNPKTNKGWSLHQFDIQRAINEGMPVDINKCVAMSRGDSRLYAQLFECAFIDGVHQYIPTGAIDSCTGNEDECCTFDGDFYAGLDIGLNSDRTTLTIVRRTGSGVVVVSAILSCKRTDQTAIDDLVEYAFTQYGIRRLCVDSTGLGAFPAQTLQRRYGVMKVEPISFTLQSKEMLATLLYTAFTSGSVMIPATDSCLKDIVAGEAKQLRLDLCSIKREITVAGNVRYDAPRTENGHADRAWSLALAIHAVGVSMGGKKVVL